jgi:hypothetical protein
MTTAAKRDFRGHFPPKSATVPLLAFVAIAIVIGWYFLRDPIGEPAPLFPVAGAPRETPSGYSDSFAGVCEELGIEGTARVFDAAPIAEDAARAAAASHAPEGPWRDAAYEGCLRGLKGGS